MTVLPLIVEANVEAASVPRLNETAPIAYLLKEAATLTRSRFYPLQLLF